MTDLSYRIHVSYGSLCFLGNEFKWNSGHINQDFQVNASFFVMTDESGELRRLISDTVVFGGQAIENGLKYAEGDFIV